MPERVGYRGDYGVDFAVVWPFLYWEAKEPLHGLGRLNRRLFLSTYNGLERSEPDVEARVIFLVRWLREQVGDDQAVDAAYARAVGSARRWRGDRPPATYLESKARGEAVLRRRAG